MDFSTRSTQAPTASAPAAAPAPKRSKPRNKLGHIGSLVLVGAIIVLLIAVVALISFGGDSNKESSYVDSSKLQAVFLNTGQVYFGKINTLNSKYFVVTDIYYLQTANSGTTAAASSANSSVSLVKLGCELHEPYDKMIINRDQVTFWENLQSNGQVAKAVSTFQKQNPNGQKCADQSSSSSTNSVNSTQGAGSTTTGTGASATPSTTTTKP